MVFQKVFVSYSMWMCLFVSVVLSQESELQVSVTTLAPPEEDVICTKCYCLENEINCSAQNLKEQPFKDEWRSLQNDFVQVLDLSHNPLKTLTKFPELPIQTLNASYCDLELIVDTCFVNLTELVTLDLSHNKLSTFTISREVFVGPRTPGHPPEQFRHIRHLSLAHNDFHSLPVDIFRFMRSLSILDLSGNPLTIIDQVTMGAISELADLKELRLSSCELEVLPEGFLRRHPRLQHLDLSDNRFATVPSVLAETNSLLRLDLCRNPFVSIEEGTSLTNLTKLRELRLSRLNRLRTVSAHAIGGLTSLKTLDLSHNPRLTTLDPKFLVSQDEHGSERWPDVEELYLNKNNLTTISSQFLGRWERLRTLDISNNPYVCDCNMQWSVLTLLPLMEMGNITHTPITCTQPPELRGMTLQYLSQKQTTLECLKTDNLVTADEAEGIIFLGVLIGIFTTFPLVLVIMLLWKKGYFSRCRKRGSRVSVSHYGSNEELSNLKYR